MELAFLYFFRVLTNPCARRNPSVVLLILKKQNDRIVFYQIDMARYVPNKMRKENPMAQK